MFASLKIKSLVKNHATFETSARHSRENQKEEQA